MTQKTAEGTGPATARMARRLKTKRGRARFKRRKVIVEPVFGRVNHVLGFRRCSFRGHAKVTAEWDLVCLATNLRRMNERMAWS